MIKRDRRNIGKRVKINQIGGNYEGRTGIVKGYRGDWGPDPSGGRPIPFVQVYVAGSIYPFPGHALEEVQDV